MTKMGVLFEEAYRAAMQRAGKDTCLPEAQPHPKSSAREIARMQEIEALAHSQDDELPLEGQKAADAALAISNHKSPFLHRWLNGARAEFHEPDKLFANYRSGDQSGRWNLHLQRAEIDPPKRSR